RRDLLLRRRHRLPRLRSFGSGRARDQGASPHKHDENATKHAPRNADSIPTPPQGFPAGSRQIHARCLAKLSRALANVKLTGELLIRSGAMRFLSGTWKRLEKALGKYAAMIASAEWRSN